MQAFETPRRLIPRPAVTAEAADGPATVRDGLPVDGWFLDEMRAWAECQAEAIRARNDWVEARRRELWASMDRLRNEFGPRASTAEVLGPAGSPGAVAPFIGRPVADHGGFSEAAAPVVVPASPPVSRAAAVLDDLAGRVNALLARLRSPEPDAPPPEPAAGTGAAG